jgi:hypothetical protein
LYNAQANDFKYFFEIEIVEIESTDGKEWAGKEEVPVTVNLYKKTWHSTQSESGPRKAPHNAAGFPIFRCICRRASKILIHAAIAPCRSLLEEVLGIIIMAT